MKKSKLVKKLSLNKVTISSLDKLRGGRFATYVGTTTDDDWPSGATKVTCPVICSMYFSCRPAATCAPFDTGC